ncbi:hypothetical protein [Paenibacillus plantarum]|uniref:hypothetical protein n=1 Tax=Paenibacillus plantarum TaxID=2654975 RepID=UPI0014931CD0|nr:hypothetical protein [Paenibacillus plantarum]
MIARGSDIITRYGVWSQTVSVNVNNPESGLHQVNIINPTDGVTISGTVSIRISVKLAG